MQRQRANTVGQTFTSFLPAQASLPKPNQKQTRQIAATQEPRQTNRDKRTVTNTQRRPLTTRDLLRFQMADDPQISPAGDAVAWVHTWMDAESNRYCSCICITDVATGASYELPSDHTPKEDAARETHPRWSPDGKWLAYLSIAGNTPAQIVVRPVGGKAFGPAQFGPARPLTHLRYGAQAPQWSPDGTRILFLARVLPARGLEALGAEAKPDLYQRYTADVMVTQRMKWKLDTVGFFGDFRTLPVVIDFDPANPALPTAQLVASGDFDLAAPSWSPDGTQIAATGNLRPEGELVRRQFIYRLDLGPNAPLPAEPQEIFGLEDIRHAGLAWLSSGDSPSSQIAIVGHNDPKIGHYGNQLPWVVDVATQTGRCIMPDYDGTVSVAAGTDMGRYGGDSGIRWLPAQKQLLGLISARGTVNLGSVDVQTGQLAMLTNGDQLVSAYTVDAPGRYAALLIRDAQTPGDLYLLDLAQPTVALRRLTDVNREILGEVEIAQPQHFNFTADDGPGSEGVVIDAWLVPPVGNNARAPVILFHGGGPAGMRSSAMTFEFQTLAAAGYAVIYCNARGCQGYGQKFCTDILGDWGGKDYTDNMQCLDTALQRFDFLDATRLGIAGGSYGGYHVNWAIGHTQRFRAAVSDRSVMNRLSTFGTSDIGPQREFEYGDAPPWETTDRYLQQSPLTYIGAAKTPTLVVHSEQDLRCPIEQGEQLYMALLRLGVPTEFVRFANESHELSRSGKPWHRVFRLDRYLDWFARYL